MAKAIEYGLIAALVATAAVGAANGLAPKLSQAMSQAASPTSKSPSNIHAISGGTPVTAPSWVIAAKGGRMYSQRGADECYSIGLLFERPDVTRVPCAELQAALAG